MTQQPETTKIGRGAVTLAWWRALRGDPERGEAGDRAALARLRRCATPTEAMAEPATLHLYRVLGFGSDEANYRLPTVAVLAMVLAHVREHAPGHPMRAVGLKSPQDEDPKLKPIRFRHLLTIADDEDLAREMRRVVALADRKLDVAELARALLRWNDTYQRDRIRAEWAFHYYAAGDAAPPRHAA